MKSNCIKYVLLSCVLGLASPSAHAASSPTSSDPSTTTIEHTELQQWLSDSVTPAVGIALVSDKGIIWSTVAGEQRQSVSASKNTLFNVASLAKPVTAELVHRLVLDSALNYDQLASGYWLEPDIADDPNTKVLTLAHLLSHQSGFPNWRAQTEGKLTFQFTPGSRPGYSGEGYEYLARISESVGGSAFDQLVETHVFEPAHVNHAHFVPGDNETSQIAHPMGPENQYGPPSIRQSASAADDLYIRVEDYGRFMTSVLAEADWLARRWQPTHNQAKMLCHPDRLPTKHCPDSLSFVMGWARFDYGEHTRFIQGGGDWGTRAMAILLPKENRALVVLTNGANGMKVVRKVVNRLAPHPDFDAFLKMQAGD